MSLKAKAALFVVTVPVTVIMLNFGAGHARQSPTQEAPPGPKMAEDAFKNIQVLKGTSADQLIPAMQFMAGSLGVDCEHCHVPHEFQKDDKQPKQIARKMITMMFAINKDNFKGRREVTCYSCHHGSKDPAGIPLITDEEVKPERAERHEGPEAAHGSEAAANSGQPGGQAPPAAAIAADEILAKYLKAVGGAEALQKFSTRVEKGTLTAFGGHSFPVEVFAKAPDKRLSVTHMPNGDNITAFNGQQGWLSGMNQPVHEMTGAEIEAARLDADFYFPSHIRDVFSQFRMRPPETIGEHQANLVLGIRSGQPPVRLYFDAQSGLLVRMVRYAETPVGLNPTQIDYADYRDAEGTKIPYRWTLARPGGRFTIQVEEVQQNVPIDDAKFAKPAETAAEKR